jgi:hypothetical protein
LVCVHRQQLAFPANDDHEKERMAVRDSPARQTPANRVHAIPNDEIVRKIVREPLAYLTPYFFGSVLRGGTRL